MYLPEELKRRLESIADQEGCSEADLIRTAIEHYTSDHLPPRPTLPLFRGAAPHDLAERDEDYLRGLGED